MHPVVVTVLAFLSPGAVVSGEFDMSQIYAIVRVRSYVGFQVKYVGVFNTMMTDPKSELNAGH